jgi:hypothetical protein
MIHGATSNGMRAWCWIEPDIFKVWIEIYRERVCVQIQIPILSRDESEQANEINTQIASHSITSCNSR